MRVVKSLQRHWIRWSVVSLVAVAAIVVGGPFVFFHFIERSPPPPLSLSSSGTSQPSRATPATAAASAAAGAIDGVWKVASGSQAGYRVQEVLFGQSQAAVGRTSAVTGSLTISGTSVSAAKFSVDLTKVTSDQSLRDQQFQGRIMDTAAYPTATLVLIRPIDLGGTPAQGVTITENAAANLTMHGTTRTVTFQVMARVSSGGVQLSASIPITFADWNIANPSGGPATTQNTGILEVLINLTKD